MNAVVQKGPILIDQNWLEANENKKADQTFAERFSNYSGKAIGAYRDLQLIKGAATIWNAYNPSSIASELSSSAGIAMGGLNVVRLPSATKDAIQAVANLSEPDGISTERKVAIALKDVAEAVAGWGYASLCITGASPLLGVARFADLTSDGADFGISISDYQQAVNLESLSTGEVQKAFTHTKNYNMLRIAKSVTSIVSGILAVLLMISGAAPLSVVAMTALSLLSALLAIRRDLHKDEGRYKVIKFESQVFV